MDTKALAKSKRAHSLNQSRKHSSYRPSKPSSTSGGGGGAATVAGEKKPTGKQVKEKTGQAKKISRLPNNWDRYEDEEYDSGGEGTAEERSGQSATDVVVPKSKGADYRHLVSEAKAQARTNQFSSLDDLLLDDFNEGLGPLLSVKGQSILSRIEDDDFLSEDKATTTTEASFLSLDLHALAEQLAKVNLSERLFIEPDILPPELLNGEMPASIRDKKLEQDASGTEANERYSDVSASSSVSAAHTEMDQDQDQDQVPTFTSEGTKYGKHVVEDWLPVKDVGQRKSATSASEVDITYGPKNPSRFEATAAEAELDMLLDSFNDYKPFDPTNISEKSSHTSYTQQEEETTTSRDGISSIQTASAQRFREVPEYSKSVEMGASLDDSIDDLLNETFNQVREVPEFSKSVEMGTSLDDSIDDLLNETSNQVVANGRLSPNAVMANGRLSPNAVISAPPDMASSSQPVSKSKLLNDFDSWLDTI